MELKQKASSTGFRTLILLDLLLREPLTKGEIIERLSKNPYITNISKETLRLDINTLKAAGFEIQNTGKANKYRYKINWSPIQFNLTRKELNVLLRTKEALIKLSNWEYIVRLYGLFEKITPLIKDENDINELMNFHQFSNIDFKTLKELNALSAKKKEVILLYNSPNSGIKEIQIKLKGIKYNGSKLYITGISKNYTGSTILRADNIIKTIKMLNTKESLKKPAVKKIICKITPEGRNATGFLDEEKILKETKNYIEIELKSDNDFMAVQRLLSFGDGLISIKNKDIERKYTDALKEILKKYGETS